jgi:transcriptional regulator with XRE-family HTH domain
VSSIDEWLGRPHGLADRLRGLRVRTGLTGKALAEALGWQPSKVSRLESGRQAPSRSDLADWVRACRADPAAADELTALLDEAQTEHRQWRRRMRRGQAPVQADYNDLAGRSRLIRYFETVYVPGHLQTAGYARRVLTEMVELHGLDVDDVDAAVTARMVRQQALYDPDRRFEFLLAEPVLYWRTAGPDVLRGQFDRLLAVQGLPNVRFGILPLRPAAPLRTVPQHAFQLYDDVAVVETFTGETVYRDEAAAGYVRVLDRLWADAVTGEEARRLLVGALEVSHRGGTVGG